MALLNILTFPDPFLRQKAVPVTDFNTELKKLVKDMLETMYDAPGVGLAANQVGVAKQVIVIDVDYDVAGEDEDSRELRNQNPKVIINPKILKKDGATVFKEGCLSVPGFTEEVSRAKHIELEFYDENGKKQNLETDGLLAIAIQHEMDHLDGKLFIDRLSISKKNLIKSKIKKERNTKFERSRFHVEL